jgi:tetrahydromethanopterin S-methyltransferase subunit G
MNSQMNRFVDISNRINELSKRLNETDSEIGKIKGNMPMFATKDDILDIHRKLDQISKPQS